MSPSIVSMILLVALATIALAAPQQAPPGGLGVQTSSGLLQGTKQQQATGNASVYQFLSVPYALAPVGKLRFQKPVPLDASQARHSIVDASKLGKTCPQFRHMTQFISPLMNIDEHHQTSEDCLRLHIYVPEWLVQQADNADALAPSDEPLPVIVWLAGEGFDFADARQFDGSHLATTSKSIVVVVQYRVGVLGFMNSAELGLGGNMGLHDQLLALNWVRENIAAFGGEPTNVSLMGRFSGSMSISSLITAPKQHLIRDKTTGKLLFKRVALISGVTVDDWILDSKQHLRAEQVYNKALEDGLCSSSNKLECLQSVPVDRLVELGGYLWRPSRDNELVGDLLPAEAVRRGQFAADLESVLFGGVKSEGSLCLYRHLLTNNGYGQLFEDDDNNQKLTPDHVFGMLRDDAHFYFKQPINKTSPIETALETLVRGELVQDQQQQQQQPTGDELAARLRESYLSACANFLIKTPVAELKRQLLAANKRAETRFNLNKKPIKVHHYELVHKPSISLAPQYIKTAAHGDDVMLLFGLAHKQAPANARDLATSRRLAQLVANFVHGKLPLLSSQSNTNNGDPSTWANEAKPLELAEHLAAQQADKPASERTRLVVIEAQQQATELEKAPTTTSKRSINRPFAGHEMSLASSSSSDGNTLGSARPEWQTTNAVLVLGVAGVALSLTTLCFVVVVVYVHRPRACRDQVQQVRGQARDQLAASSYNICADTDDQAALANQKDGRQFNSVFAKLTSSRSQETQQVANNDSHC